MKLAIVLIEVKGKVVSLLCLAQLFENVWGNRGVPLHILRIVSRCRG